jgi:hypothetical protein
MALESRVKNQLAKLLSFHDEAGGKGNRLVDDAERLWGRVHRFVEMKLVAGDLDHDALELACHAVQLPLRFSKGTGRKGQVTLRERCEQGAELLINHLDEIVADELLERTSELLHETLVKAPGMDEARLLADALNLDDFGVTGAMLLAMQCGRQNVGIRQFMDSFEKREQYGYWSARLKDGFHFEPVREMARKRVEAARKLVEMLGKELKEDGG